MNRLPAIGLALLVSACGGGGSGPAQEPYEGRWTGSYTNSASQQAATAQLQLTQDGQAVTGSLSTSDGRTALVSGTVSGDQLEAGFQFTDTCAGTASTTATLIDEAEPDQLEGSYTATDCLGDTQGGYTLVRD